MWAARKPVPARRFDKEAVLESAAARDFDTGAARKPAPARRFDKEAVLKYAAAQDFDTEAAAWTAAGYRGLGSDNSRIPGRPCGRRFLSFW